MGTRENTSFLSSGLAEIFISPTKPVAFGLTCPWKDYSVLLPDEQTGKVVRDILLSIFSIQIHTNFHIQLTCRQLQVESLQ